jgi:hypothetical protein
VDHVFLCTAHQAFQRNPTEQCDTYADLSDVISFPVLTGGLLSLLPFCEYCSCDDAFCRLQMARTQNTEHVAVRVSALQCELL